MNQIIKNKFVYTSFLIGAVSFHASFAASIERIFEVNKPVDLVNTTGLPLKMVCEIRASSTQTHYVSISILNGKGVYNGTSFKRGDFMTSALTNLQQVILSADAVTQARITNTGPANLKAICEY
ncbi:hypothetical protein [Legionella waltersii]|uniref:Uncharacterized protein n=1 Tax=Legionella waltersii TaxID=66969 RepID=A0A0W1ADL1_9GAMM|nr:hypothetical protein [Legionella waltersii]KTD79431.1 hypothetical protein Lwal_1503 [Legionella waltersii]SNU97688.1 Uncharacterised protein [Legionella waltersii]